MVFVADLMFGINHRSGNFLVHNVDSSAVKQIQRDK